MIVRYFAVAAVSMLIGAAAVVFFFGLARSPEKDNVITLGDKNYFDNNDYSVSVSGTLTGKDMDRGDQYLNNSYRIVCIKERMECMVAYIQQIGPNQTGNVDVGCCSPITKWNEYEIVAVDPRPEETFDWHCFRTTITIERESKSVVWVEEPVNQAKAGCKNSNTTIRKFTLEDSSSWKRATSERGHPRGP